MEFENVRQALEYLLDVAQSTEMITKTYDGTGLIEERKATVKDMQEYMFDVTVNIADLLGLEEIYLEKEETKWK